MNSVELAFWTLAPVMVIAALGLLVVRKAVHAALLLAVVMICLAVQYAALDAPFLFAVQIVVYTGAILMLFLFVLMLVGVTDDALETARDVIRGQRPIAVVVSVALGAVLILGVAQGVLSADAGLDKANAAGNLNALADLIFSRYVIAFEVTSALLITAAIGAMMLAHTERLTPRRTQAELAAQRVADWSESGKALGPLPAPGTLATSNGVETPILLADGSHYDHEIEESR